MELSEESKQAVIDFFEQHTVDGVAVDFSSDIAQGVPEVFGVGEALGLVIAGVVLLVMLGSLLPAGLPIVTALVGVGIGVLASLAFSGVVSMASVTPVLGVMLGLAVGIDYSLFIVHRHRRQLAHGLDLHESIAMANGTAGNAVLFAGTTVMIALLALNFTGITFLGVMGTVGAVCIAVAVLIAVTATPALLGLIGPRALSPRARARLVAPAASGTRAVAMSTRRAVVTIVLGVAALVVVAVPAASMRLGLPDGSAEPADSTSYRAYQVTADAFGPGSNGTLLVTARLPTGLDEAGTAAAQLEVARAVAALDDVRAVAPIAVSDTGLAAFQVKPGEGPNAASTEQLVRDLRATDVLDGTTLEGTALGVAGQAAINIDISANLADVLPLYLAVVVGLSLLIMIVVFRSLLVPLVATGGFVLSLLATYGAIVAVFQWGWLGGVVGITNPGPVLSFLPVMLVGILFGLAMDYQLFLASGMREAFVHGAPARTAVMQGFRAGRTVVVAAALIMASVFGGFVLSDSVIIRSVGFGLAVGVLLDAFVVRLLVVPAVLHLLGRSAWWLPGWLDRLLPNVDVEGAALERRHHVPL
jgi:putative drug exporter of the RND superfamily